MDYMDKTLEERQQHLRPDEPCNFDWNFNRHGFPKPDIIREQFGQYIGTGQIKGAHCAHHCGNGAGSHSIGCRNNHHLYWATPKENCADTKRHGIGPSSPDNREKMRDVHDRISVIVYMNDGSIITAPSMRNAGIQIVGDQDKKELAICVWTISNLVKGIGKTSPKYNIESVIGFNEMEREMANYIDNEKFQRALEEYLPKLEKAIHPHGRLKHMRAAGVKIDYPKVPDYIGLCFMQIAEGLSKKPNFAGYGWVDDMVSDAILACLANIDSYDYTNRTNPFAYYTRACYNAFLIRIDKEKKRLKSEKNFLNNYDIYDIQELNEQQA